MVSIQRPMTTRRSPQRSTTAKRSNTVAMAAIGLGCVSLAIGVFGLGFRTVGLIDLESTITACVVGAIAIVFGLTTPPATSTTTPRRSSTASPQFAERATMTPPHANPMSVHHNDWSAPTPERVYVHSWRDDERALPPGA